MGWEKSLLVMTHVTHGVNIFANVDRWVNNGLQADGAVQKRPDASQPVR